MLTDIYKDWYNKLNKGERRLFVILVIVSFTSLYCLAFLRPTAVRITTLKRQKEEAVNRSRLLVLRFPDVDKAKSELEAIRERIETVKLKTLDIENSLIGVSQVPQFLTQLIEAAQGLTIDFQSVKQKVDEAKEGSRLFIDLKFDSSYEDAVNYLKKVEEISPFVKVSVLEIVQSKKDPQNLTSVSLRLTAILASAPENKGELSKAPTSPDSSTRLSVSRSPLIPKFGPGQAKKPELKLTGITYRGPGLDATAIINDTVVRPGDVIEGQKVEDILPDAVLINNGGLENIKLKIER